MISFSLFTSIAVDKFQENAGPINDRRLIAWLQLQSIADDVENMKQNAEIHAEGAIDSDSTHNDIALCRDRLRTWEEEMEPAVWTGKRDEHFHVKCPLSP